GDGVKAKLAEDRLDPLAIFRAVEVKRRDHRGSVCAEGVAAKRGAGRSPDKRTSPRPMIVIQRDGLLAVGALGRRRVAALAGVFLLGSVARPSRLLLRARGAGGDRGGSALGRRHHDEQAGL